MTVIRPKNVEGKIKKKNSQTIMNDMVREANITAQYNTMQHRTVQNRREQNRQQDAAIHTYTYVHT